jgi:hypothetical protein
MSARSQPQLLSSSSSFFRLLTILRSRGYSRLSRIECGHGISASAHPLQSQPPNHKPCHPERSEGSQRNPYRKRVRHPPNTPHRHQIFIQRTAFTEWTRRLSSGTMPTNGNRARSSEGKGEVAYSGSPPTASFRRASPFPSSNPHRIHFHKKSLRPPTVIPSGARNLLFFGCKGGLACRARLF